MKICIINIHRLVSSGGSEIQCDIIANELITKGHEVIYVSPTGKQNDDKFSSCNYKVISIQDSVCSFYKVLKEINPDVVYWRSYKRLFLPVSIVVRMLGIKLVFAVSHIHDIDPAVFLKYRIRTIKDALRTVRNISQTVLQRIGYRNCQAITSLNSDYCDLIPGMEINFVPNAMNISVEQFTWPRPFVLWVANIKAPKHPELFVKLSKEFENFGIDFLMVGRFHEEFSQLSWIRDGIDTPSNFYYLGEKHPNIVNGMLERSLFHVHTCEPEGFGNIFIQAWMLKKPSISLKFNPGSVLDGRIGYFCDDNWHEFVDKCHYLADNRSERERMGKAAYEHAIATYTPKRLGEQVDILLRQVHISNSRLEK